MLKKILSPYSLKKQLLMRTFFILAIILLLIGIVQYWIMRDFLYQNEANALNDKLGSLPLELLLNEESKSTKPKGKDNPLPANQPFLFYQGMSLAIIDTNGNYQDILGNSGVAAPIFTKKEYLKMLQHNESIHRIAYHVRENSKGIEQLVVFRPLGGPHESHNRADLTLQLGTNTAPLKKILLQQLLTFIVLASIALTSGLVIYLRTLKHTLVPLSTIVDVVKKTDVENLTERLPVKQGQEEIDRLAESFNAMLARLEISFEYERETKEQMRRFIADASHELRTPLTSINGFIEVLLRGAANQPEQLYQALNSMQGESKRIIKLVEDLFTLVKLDQAPSLQVSQVNVTKIIKEMRSQLDVLAGNRTVYVKVSEERYGYYEPNKLKQVFLNLFYNAVQHTDPETGVIHLSLDAINDSNRFTIQDNGAGIDSKDLPFIFNRFYRADISRTRTSGGSGLGLSITKSIVEAHGGRIEVTSKMGNGTTFQVFLPFSPKKNH
ncbi:sensor histidine kinase [Virgibacillus soli]|uniref:sensor histidine kinase n=1 Tax=Paracerasibacillus soli TaxID=480284 RepID=UPI0035ED1957